MFSATEDPLPPHSFVERARKANDLLDRPSVATPAQGIVRVVVERNVEHGTKVQVESEQPEKPPGNVAVPPDKRDIATIAQLLGIRRFVADQTQPRNPSALLIDRDDRLDVAQVAEIVDQLPELGRALDIASKKNETARLNAPKQGGALGIKFVAGNTSED